MPCENDSIHVEIIVRNSCKWLFIFMLDYRKWLQKC